MTYELSMKDILLIDKPKGITSFDCIRILRCNLGVKKLGHAGTLDPMATGLMVIGVGEGTKSLGQYLKFSKTYEAEILLGLHTNTGDIEGRELPISNDQFPNNTQISKISNEEIRKIFAGMVGKLQLPVPVYSAVKRGGEALYKKARRGEVVDAPVKTMEVISAEFLGMERRKNLAFAHGREQMLKNQDKAAVNGIVVHARFDVCSGTYVRSLAEEFGRRLGIPATLSGLRRTSIGEFKVEDAKSLEK